MKIYEVTGKIRENPQQGIQQAKVVRQAGNELTVAPQAQGQPTGTEVTVDLSKNPQAIQKDPQGNITVDPNAQPNPTGGMTLQPGQEINIAGAPGAMLPNQKPGQPQQGQQDQAAAEDMANMKKLAGIKEQPAEAGSGSQIPPNLTVDGMLNDPEVDPAMKPQLQQMIVAKPDGTLDLAQTMRNASGKFYREIPELIEILQSLAQQAAAFVKSPEFSELGPQDQNSIIDLAKTLPSSIQQMQAQITKGAQAHDAGFNKMDADTGQYGDGTVEDASMQPMDDSYYPTGYNDKYREKAMMRKAFQSVTQDDSYMEESNHIVALAKRVANVPSTTSTNNSKDIVDIKKLAGL